MAKTSPWWPNVRNVFFVFMLDWLWSMVVMSILRLMKGGAAARIHDSLLDRAHGIIAGIGPNMPAWATFALIVVSVVVVAPVVEELLFRYLPLTLVRGTGKAREIAVVIGICGVLFGYLHGSVWNVFAQGAGGALYGWLFLRNHSSAKAAYASCVAVHAMHNGGLILLALLSA